MHGTPTDWQERAIELVRSLIRVVWGLEPAARPAPAVLVERTRGPAA
jgi:hypothetical protein